MANITYEPRQDQDTVSFDVSPTTGKKEDRSGISSNATQTSGKIANDHFISSLHQTSLYKSPQQFLEDLIIARAPEKVRRIKRPKPSSSTPAQIAKYRERVLNHPDTKHRFVFREWPRDPKGKIITPDKSQPGMMSVMSGIEIWAPTLFDLFTVRRIPTVEKLMTYSSGTKLAKCMKNLQETYAKDLIDQQTYEFPEVIEPYDIGDQVKEHEMLLANGGTFPKKSWNKDDLSKRFELPQVWPPASPFSPSAYPSPWPILPFTNQTITHIPTLQKYIPASLLPAKLVVHDPFEVLGAPAIPRNPTSRERKRFTEKFKRDSTVKWDEKEDKTYTYRLKHSELNKFRREHDSMQHKAEAQHRLEVRKKFLVDPHTKTELPEGFELHPDIDSGPGPVKPPIFVVLPSLPQKKQIKEAHLYIAPVGHIGEGNHSFVYRAELEIPRNVLVEPEICDQCLIDDANAILLEQDGEKGERRDPKWDKKSGEYAIKITDICPEITEMKDPITGKKEKYVVEPGEYKKELVYEGPFRVIESRVQYQDLAKGPYCKHLRGKDSAIHPLTSKAYVAAKLSKKSDPHLAVEAENYQKFPKHFFEHWSGYNILQPIHDPVRVGAVVPQFYGHYVVDLGNSLQKSETEGTDNKEGNSSSIRSSSESQDSADGDDFCSLHGDSEGAEGSYLSPILLLEYCGEPVVPEGISKDDRTEAGSLIYRFHHEGWLHGSVAKRNIVRQPGPIFAPPAERAKNAKARGGLGKDWSFRLIDFGRSTLGKPDQEVYTHSQILEAKAITGWIGGWEMDGDL